MPMTRDEAIATVRQALDRFTGTIPECFAVAEAWKIVCAPLPEVPAESDAPSPPDDAGQ